MIALAWLPHLNAGLNAASAVLPGAGFAAIRRQNMPLHRRLTLSAVTASGAFLVAYLSHLYPSR